MLANLAAANAVPWLEGLVAFLHAAQLAALHLLDALGLTPHIDGQPAWPWRERIAADMLRIDLGHARHVLLALLASALMLLLGLLALAWRRRRLPLLVGIAAVALLTPWPAASLLLTPAAPTSFHVSPTAFDVASIQAGEALYRQHCASCHGGDAAGEGPRAATLPMWPPDLTRGLLWQRSDGELLTRVRDGLRDRAGRLTMPGFADSLHGGGDWAVLDYLRALAAGQSLLRRGQWASPVALPAMSAQCGADRQPRRLGHGPGQRLRLIAAGHDADVTTGWQPDPRFDTVLIRPALPADGADRSGAPLPPGVDCEVASDAAWQAFALIAGVPAATLDGTQWLADRQGWLRAIARPPFSDWSVDDMVCRSGDGTPTASPSSSASAVPPVSGERGLGALIARIDAEPVIAIRGGYRH